MQHSAPSKLETLTVRERIYSTEAGSRMHRAFSLVVVGGGRGGMVGGGGEGESI
jgi:hypothetical protein